VVEGGFRSNGERGYRNYGPGYYAAYLFDPDGNNVEALYRVKRRVGQRPGMSPEASRVVVSLARRRL
jgi:hypothetical protein